MFEARLTWTGGSLRVSGDGVPADLERLREHLYETARLMGASDVAMQLVVTSEDGPPERSHHWMFRPRDASDGRRRRDDGRPGSAA